MKIYILVLLSIFIFKGCATSSLKVSSENQLLLHHDNKITTLGKGVLNTQHQWYKNLEIYKSKIQNNKGVLLHEYLVSDINYEFIYGPVMTIKYIFDAYESDVIYMNANLVLLQLRVNKTQYVNMLVEKSGNQELSYVYGFSNEEFIELAKNMISQSAFVLKKLKYQAIMFKKNAQALSTWSVQMLFLNPLLKQVNQFGAGY